MKKFLLSTVFSAVAAMAVYQAKATPIPAIHGPLTVSWTVDQQKTLDVTKYPEPGKTNITGSVTDRTTNVTQITSSTYSTAPFDNTELLALLANSLDTTFPAGTELVTDGSNLYVSDHTGTNAIVDISTILTVTGTNKVVLSTDMRTTSSTKSGTIITDKGSSSGTQFITVTYNDSALTTKDGTTSVFVFAGVSAYSSSGSSVVATNDVVTVKDSGSFKITGTGSGTIRGEASIIVGTISGTPTGSEKITIP